jgi:hypothetical protein
MMQLLLAQLLDRGACVGQLGVRQLELRLKVPRHGTELVRLWLRLYRGGSKAGHGG